jgi:hypothetical protein
MYRLVLLFFLIYAHLTYAQVTENDQKSLIKEIKALTKTPEVYDSLKKNASYLESLIEQTKSQEQHIAELENQLKVQFLQIEKLKEEQTQAGRQTILNENLRHQAGLVYHLRFMMNDSLLQDKIRKQNGSLFINAFQSPDSVALFSLAYGLELQDVEILLAAIKNSDIQLLRDGKPIINTLRNDFTDFIAEDEQTKAEIYNRINREHNNKGTENAQISHRRTGVVQRTGHGRGTDHEILIDDLISGKISERFSISSKLHFVLQRAEFHDIGASVDKPLDMYGDADAPMTFDFYENVGLKHRLKVIAHDLNEKDLLSNNEPMDFIDRYKRKVASGQKKAYPFGVHAIPMLIKSVEDLGINPLDTTPLILRACNAIDIYYSPGQSYEHFKGLTQSTIPRAVLYIFNNQILYKPKNNSLFIQLGTMADGFSTEGNVPVTFWKEKKGSRNSNNAYFLKK